MTNSCTFSSYHTDGKIRFANKFKQKAYCHVNLRPQNSKTVGSRSYFDYATHLPHLPQRTTAKVQKTFGHEGVALAVALCLDIRFELPEEIQSKSRVREGTLQEQARESTVAEAG